MKTRLIIAWLLLLIPTLILGIGALRLLENEESRLTSQARETAQSRILAIADSINVSVAEVQSGLLETLRTLPRENLVEHLDDWKRTNPLVRNVFVWQQGRGLLYPDPEQPASARQHSTDATPARRIHAFFNVPAVLVIVCIPLSDAPKGVQLSN